MKGTVGGSSCAVYRSGFSSIVGPYPAADCSS